MTHTDAETNDLNDLHPDDCYCSQCDPDGDPMRGIPEDVQPFLPRSFQVTCRSCNARVFPAEVDATGYCKDCGIERREDERETDEEVELKLFSTVHNIALSEPTITVKEQKFASVSMSSKDFCRLVGPIRRGRR